MMHPVVSICIPTRNRNDSLLKLVASLITAAKKAHFQKYEIVIVDGAPGDTVKRLFTGKQKIRVYSGPGDATSARNIAGKQAQSQFLAFIDDDTYVAEDYFEQLAIALGAILTTPNIQGIVGNTIRSRNYSALDDAWLGAGFDRFFDLSTRADFLRWGCTSNLVVRKDTFERIGGFRSAAVPVGGEDIDFGMRATNNGAFISCPQLRVYHIAIEHNDVQPIAIKASYYGASEQWLAHVYPQFARLHLAAYYRYVRLRLTIRPTLTQRLQSAFLAGGIRAAFRRRTLVRTLSPVKMALAIDPAQITRLSKTYRPHRHKGDTT